MDTNFDFLSKEFPILFSLAQSSTDPNAALFKMKLFSESIFEIHQLEFSYCTYRKAFKDKLVKQLPTDGDARELLEEIQKVKAELSKTIKPKRGKTRKIKDIEGDKMVAELREKYGK